MPSVADLPLLSVHERVLLPGSVQCFDLLGPEADALVAALSAEAEPSLVVRRSGGAGGADAPSVGVEAAVLAHEAHATGGHRLKLAARRRVRFVAVEERAGVLSARLDPTAPDTIVDPELTARFGDAVARFIRSRPELPEGSEAHAATLADLGELADLLAGFLTATPEQLARLIPAIDSAERVAITLELIEAELAAGSVPSATADNLDLSEPWILSDGGEARLAQRVAAGEISEADAADLRHYLAHGWVVWERAIEEELIDELVHDVRNIARYPGHFVTTAHKEGRDFRYSTADFDSYESIFDTYVNYESARRVCFHPKILRFLHLLFEERPVAFQQLLFQRSNGHPLHQDTAYVTLEKPLQMAATWVALEDVIEGRGELVYYDKSHRIPHVMLSNGTKRFDAQRDKLDEVVTSLRERCAAIGSDRRHFIAKKGDVFLWAADLVHGSADRTRPAEETRMSCVTHYCPESTRPFWWRTLANNRGRQEWEGGAFIASTNYQLPKWESGGWDGVVRPTFDPPGEHLAEE